MPITPFLIAKHLSDLVGRPVQAARVEKPIFAAHFVFACYDIENLGAPSVIKIDMPLLGSLAGVMMGVPGKVVETQLKAGSLDENLDDAANEIMNVLTGIFQEQRVLFKGLYKTPELYSPAAVLVMRSAAMTMLPLKVTVAGYPGGSMTIASNY